MEKSDQLNELFGALAKAQAKIHGAAKDAKNPFYKSDYATLDACWAACRDPLSVNGLSIIQTVSEDQGKLYLTTILGHSSGQYISSRVPLPINKPDPQALGSCLSYMRRYSLCAIVGITQSDDDAEEAMPPASERNAPPVSVTPVSVEYITSDEAQDIENLIRPDDKEYRLNLLQFFSTKDGTKIVDFYHMPKKYLKACMKSVLERVETRKQGDQIPF